jgi:hypothetical protein
VLALARTQSIVALHIDLTVRSGHDVLDLPEVFRRLVAAERDLLCEDGNEQPACLGGFEAIERATSPTELHNGLLDVIQSGNGIVILQNISAGTKQTRIWCDRLLAQAVEMTSGFMLVVDKKKMSLPESAIVHRLNPFRETQVTRHLKEKLGYSAAEAQAEAAAIHRLANGAPQPILFEMVRRVTSFVEKAS